MAAYTTSHLQTVCREWAAVRAAWTGTGAVSVTGDDLTIADVVAVALCVRVYLYLSFSSGPRKLTYCILGMASTPN